MAVSQIKFDKTTQQGLNIDRALRSVGSGREGLTNTIAVLLTMIDGDGSDASHFTRMTSECGFETNAVAKAGFDELASLKGKITTDGSVTFVDAAISQAMAKFGVVIGY